MSQDNLIKLRNKETGQVYHTSKNKKKLANAPKLSLRKYDKVLRKHTSFDEVKK